MIMAQCALSLVLVVFGAINVAGFYDGLVHNEVNRAVDISAQLEEIEARIDVMNVGSDDVSEYFVSIPRAKRSHLAYIEASKKKQTLEVAEVQLADQPKDNVYFAVKFDTPLESKKRRKFIVRMAFTHVLSPLPAEIAQSQTQFMKYEGTAHFYTPYKTKEQKTEYKTSNSKVESHSKVPKPIARKGAKITAGPYGGSESKKGNVAPYSKTPFEVHYQNSNPFITVKNVLREIEVSHWGRVSISEWYDVANTGAKLTGPYSMLEQQQRRSPQKAAFREFVAELPRSADNVYFTDRIGNISSSNMHRNRNNVKLELRPRYTLYGGWECDFNFGYQVPSNEFISVSTEDSSAHRLELPVSIPFEDCVIDNLTVKVILPEGARDIDAHLPFSVDYLGEETHKSYLDITGRPVVVFNKKNVVKHHQRDFSVTYTFTTLAILREPMFLFAGFFAGLMIFLGFSYVSVSLSVKGDNPLDLEVSKPAELNGLFDDGRPGGGKKGRARSSSKGGKASAEQTEALIQRAEKFAKACDDGVRKGSLSKTGDKTYNKLSDDLDQLAKADSSLASLCTRIGGMSDDMKSAVSKKDRAKLGATARRFHAQLEKLQSNRLS